MFSVIHTRTGAVVYRTPFSMVARFVASQLLNCHSQHEVPAHACEHCGGRLAPNDCGDLVCIRVGLCFAAHNAVQPRELVRVPATADLCYLHEIEPQTNEPYVCETHPDRVLGTAPLVRAATAYTVDGQAWTLYLTDDGWAIGDEKIMAAICPECTERVYRVERE